MIIIIEEIKYTVNNNINNTNSIDVVVIVPLLLFLNHEIE